MGWSTCGGPSEMGATALPRAGAAVSIEAAPAPASGGAGAVAADVTAAEVAAAKAAAAMEATAAAGQCRSNNWLLLERLFLSLMCSEVTSLPRRKVFIRAN